MGGNKKIPLKFKLYKISYPLKIFIKSLLNKLGGEKMGNFNLFSSLSVHIIILLVNGLCFGGFLIIIIQEFLETVWGVSATAHFLISNK